MSRNHAKFLSNIKELREYIIKYNGLPDSKKKFYRFINNNEDLDPQKNKYVIWMGFLEENYDLFKHTHGCYQKTCENLWLYLLNKCSFLNERPGDPDCILYKWFHFNNKHVNDCKKNSGKEWYPIKDQKYKEHFKIFLKENPQLAFN
jgi:hypothetical protein